MTPTREQVIEGRDEALETMGLGVEEWDEMPTKDKQDIIRWRGDLSHPRTVIRAAVWTVLLAEQALAGWPLDLSWLPLRLHLAYYRPRQTNYALQA